MTHGRQARSSDAAGKKMRFRGKLVDISCIQHFSRVVATIAKLAKTCTLRITSDKLYFILSERAVNGGVSMWCELTQGNFFNEFNMDGVSPEANEIYLELTPDNLVRTLKTAQNAKSVKVKLTKKHTPCLTLEIELPTVTTHSRLVTHDVPVNVIPRRLWEEFEEPEMPDFDVSIAMPPLRLLRNMVDRLKTLSNFIIISANHAGEMKLGVETDLVTVTTHFRDLEHPSWCSSQQDSEPTQADKHKLVQGRVDIRRFSQFLMSQQVNPAKVICNILDERIVHFFVLHDDISLQYFMPAVSI